MAFQEYISNQYFTELSNHLGGMYPYYNKELPDSCTLSFAEALSFRKANNLTISLDKTALVTKACLPFLIGNRTLIQNVSKHLICG